MAAGDIRDPIHPGVPNVPPRIHPADKLAIRIKEGDHVITPTTLTSCTHRSAAGPQCLALCFEGEYAFHQDNYRDHGTHFVGHTDLPA